MQHFVSLSGSVKALSGKLQQHNVFVLCACVCVLNSVSRLISGRSGYVSYFYISTTAVGGKCDDC